MAPVDVVLDRDRALIVQPDVLFVSAARLSIIRDQVWGAPDLVAEVLSHSTKHRDRGEKLGWYRQYGVRECWLVDLYDDSVTVVDFTGSSPESRVAKGVDCHPIDRVARPRTVWLRAVRVEPEPTASSSLPQPLHGAPVQPRCEPPGASAMAWAVAATAAAPTARLRASTRSIVSVAL